MPTDSARAGMPRRQFLRNCAAVSGGLILNSFPMRSQVSNLLPDPSRSGIEHIVLVMMENRSFDHFLGWVPGADGRQNGLVYQDGNGQSHSTYHLTDFQGCGHPDPDHSFVGGRVELNGGACDGWLRAGKNDLYAIGYYTQGDFPFFGDAALHWTVWSLRSTV